MRRPIIGLVLAVCWGGPAFALSLPPIQNPQMAVQQLSLTEEAQRLAALANFGKACRGRMRHALKDNAAVIRALQKLSKEGSPQVQKGVMDVGRCISPTHFLSLLLPQLASEHAPTVAYAAEIGARVQTPEVTSALLDQLEAKKAMCAKEDLGAEELDACVWLTYAPGASISKMHPEPVRKRAGALAREQLSSPHPKVREVAVESIAATQLPELASAIDELVKNETEGKFAKPNDKALLRRFADRAKKLGKSGR